MENKNTEYFSEEERREIYRVGSNCFQKKQEAATTIYYDIDANPADDNAEICPPYREGLPYRKSANTYCVCANEYVGKTIQPNEMKSFFTGIVIDLPPLWECQIRPVPGLVSKGIILANAGHTISHYANDFEDVHESRDLRNEEIIIDKEDRYSHLEEVKVVLLNAGKKPYTVSSQENIAILAFAPVWKVFFEHDIEVNRKFEVLWDPEKGEYNGAEPAKLAQFWEYHRYEKTDLREQVRWKYRRNKEHERLIQDELERQRKERRQRGEL
jgi:dUTPase